MREIIFKDLNKPVDINDVYFRIQSINKGGWAILLPYKNARYDMDVLDDVCGPENWQRRYTRIGENLFCSIGIKSGDEWIWKEDVGVESFAEKEKGQASDASKRAGFAWGIGREIYSWGHLSVQLKADEYYETAGRMKPTFNLAISKWKWTLERDDKGNVIKITAKDQNGDLRYDTDKSVAAPEVKEKEYTADDIGSTDDNGIPIVNLTLKEVEESWNGKIYTGNVVYIDGEKVRPITSQLEKLKSHTKFQS